jgi:hypothetical protein
VLILLKLLLADAVLVTLLAMVLLQLLRGRRNHFMPRT